MPTLATFKSNTFFRRYRFAGTYPGDASEKSAIAAAQVGTLGYVPGKSFGKYKKDDFIIWDAKRRALAAQALAERDGKLPDILCLQEVENLDAIRRFNEDHLDDHYPYMLLVDGWEPRNIDVGVLSVLPIVEVRSHIDDRG